MLQLTRPDGQPIWVAPAQVVSVTAAVAGEADHNAHTRVLTLSGPTWVREAAADVVHRLQGAQ